MEILESSKNNEFLIKYEGDFDGLDPRIVSSLLIGVSDIIEILNNDNNENSKKIKLYIKPFRQGSFEIFFNLIEQINNFNFSDQLFDDEFISNISLIYKKFKLLLEIKNFLNGLLPKKIIDENEKEYRVVNNEDLEKLVEKKVYDLLIKDNKINKSLQNIFFPISKNKEIKRFTINLPNLPTTEYKSENFESLSKNLYEIYEKSLEQNTVSKFVQPLRVYTIVFDVQKKWKLYYKNELHDFTIEDNDFKEKVQAGLFKFKNNDYLIVDFDEVKFENGKKNKTEFIITKVYRVEEISNEKLDLFYDQK